MFILFNVALFLFNDGLIVIAKPSLTVVSLIRCVVAVDTDVGDVVGEPEVLEHICCTAPKHWMSCSIQCSIFNTQFASSSPK